MIIMTKKKWKKPIMVPAASGTMEEMRFEIAKQKGYATVKNMDWWDNLTPMQKSEVNGVVTKLLVIKAQQDFMTAFNNKK